MRNHSAPELELPSSAACHAFEPASKTGASTGSTRSGKQGVPHAQAGGERAVEHAGARQADRGEQGGHDGQPEHVDAHVEEERHPGPEHDLEHEELQAHGGRLAQEDAGRVDAREAQSVPGALP